MIGQKSMNRRVGGSTTGSLDSWPHVKLYLDKTVPRFLPQELIKINYHYHVLKIAKLGVTSCYHQTNKINISVIY